MNYVRTALYRQMMLLDWRSGVYLVTYVESKQQAEEASRRISTMTFEPRLVDVFEKSWTIN